MTVQTWVGQFGIVQGQALEAGPWQGKFDLHPSGEEPVTLYVLVQPALPGSEEFCGQLVAVVGHLFERQDLSLTGALTKAISAAHENLREWNRRSLREHQVGAGLSCLVVRGTVAYLAQAGPSLAYYRRDSGLTRVAPDEPRAVAVLGLGDELRPQLRRYELVPGDLLLVASPSLADIADEARIEALLSRDAEEVLSELYLLARDQPDFSVFLLSCFEEAGDIVETIVPPELRAEPPEEPPAPRPTLTVESGSLRRPPDESHEEETESKFHLLGSLEFAPVAAAVPESGRQTVRLRGSQPGIRSQRPSPVAKVSARLPGWLLPAVVFLGLVVLLAWWVVPGSMEGNRTAKFDSLLAGATDDYNAALTLSDLTEKRRALDAVSSQIAEAADIRSDDSELTALEGEVDAALAEMNGVQELAGLRLVADLTTQLTGDLSLQQLVVGGGYAYLLDAKEGRVVSVSLSSPDGATEEVLREGDLVGMAKVARPSRIAWLPDVNGGNLLILDSERHLFSLRPGAAPVPLVLEGSDSWGSLDAVFAGVDGFYVLDGQKSQLWLYPAIEDEFAKGPESVLEGVDLSGAKALAVNGDIYLLGEDGRIRRFSAGQEVAFEMEGIDRPLASPASLLPLADGSLLVADSGNKRIVLFTPDGRFQRQYVSNQLLDPRSVAVDEVAARLYVLNGDSLFAADLPSASTPSNPPPGDGPTPADAAP
jgi:hypothetical protein